MRYRTVAASLALVLAASTPAQAAALRAIRFITAPSTTRLIVEFSAPVQHQLQRVVPRPDLGVPARLYVDFPDAQLSAGVPVPPEFSEGPLLRLRSSQDDTRLRLILDVPGLTEFDAFPIPDPFRLVIDVRGTPRVGSGHSDSPNGSRPATALRPAAPAATIVASVPRSGRTPAGRTAADRVPAGHPTVGRDAVATRLPTPVARRFKIVLDPGHGGKDPGAFGVGGIAEKDVVLAIAQRLRDRLAAVPGIDVGLTRDADVFLALEERTARANAEHADLFVSIHANASPNPALSGVETYYLNNSNDRATLRLAEMENGLRSLTGHDGHDRDAVFILSDLIQNYKVQESVALAENVQRALVAELDAQGTRVKSLGVKRGPFYVLVGAGMPCVLVEVSFLTHPTEGERLARTTYQESIAAGLLHGIQRFVENMQVAENL